MFPLFFIPIVGVYFNGLNIRLDKEIVRVVVRFSRLNLILASFPTRRADGGADGGQWPFNFRLAVWNRITVARKGFQNLVLRRRQDS